MFRYLLFLLVIESSLWSAAIGQIGVNQFKVDSDFELAVQLYNSGQYEIALVRFEKIINDYDLNSKTSASYFFKIKILIDRKDYSEAKYTVSRFIEKFPASEYVEEVRIQMVEINLGVHDYFDALKEIAFLIERTNSIAYRIEAKDIGDKIADNFLNSSDLQQLYDSFTSKKVKPFLLLLLAKSFLKERDVESASIYFSKILQSYSSSEEYPEAKNLYENPVLPAEYNGTASIIGVLLPLKMDSTGDYTSTAAAEILDGVKFAISEFNDGRDDKIGIVIRDTENDIDRISEIRDEIGDNAEIKVILGPIFSNEVRITLNEFEGTDLAIISPTATDNDLIFVSEDFFQANPPLAVRGKIMAQYVYFVENKRLMAVLNAIDGYSPLLAATFSDEFERLGGTITVKATYKSNSFSLSEPILKIAEADTLEGIYIPLTDKIDATAILSQLGQDSIYYPIYGNQDWFTAKGFESAPELSNMLTFSSDYFIDFTDEDYNEFSDNYSEITGKDPNRNVLYGYDIAKYLLTIMRNISPGRTNIKNKIISGIMSKGFHNNISFDENRINRFLNIVRYKDGIFKLVEKFRFASQKVSQF
jgi:branched-chain amino acid transport system substrate-binding protein